MRIVCDTNVLISALVFPGGPPDQVFELARAGQVEHFTSPDILAEFRKVLSEKFRYSETEAGEFVGSVVAMSTLVYPSLRLRVITRKDADNRILEAAKAAEADLLVTGDRRDLLPLVDYDGIKIVTPADALSLI